MEETLIYEYFSRVYTCIPIMDYSKAIKSKNDCLSRDCFLTGGTLLNVCKLEIT